MSNDFEKHILECMEALLIAVNEQALVLKQHSDHHQQTVKIIQRMLNIDSEEESNE